MTPNETSPDQAVEAVAVTQADREYRKTATIRARQWWQMGDHPAVELASDVTEAIRKGEPVPFIFTMEGGYLVTPGDWIATGVHGEHWAIKPDVFRDSYTPVEPAMDFGEAIDPNASHNRRHRLSAIPTPPPADHTDRIARGEAKLKAWVEYDPPAITRESSRLRHAYFSGWEAADALQAHASPRELEPILERLRDVHRRNPSEYNEVCGIIDAIRTALELG